MENEQVAQQPAYCQCRQGHRRGWGVIGGFFRLIGLVVVLAVIFVAGCIAGGRGPVAFFHHAWGPGETSSGMMLKGEEGTFNMKFGGGERQFGVITAISGQTITIADNGGGTQTILVDADTVVVDGTKEIPVWNLRKGNSVRIHGRMKEALRLAKLIEVIR